MLKTNTEKKDYILFGCGYYGQAAAVTLGKDNIRNFVDNDREKWGSMVLGIEVISPQMLLVEPRDYKCIVALANPAASSVSQQLSDMGIEHTYFDIDKYERRPRLISYSQPLNLEDVILYEVLRDETDLFYIDVGCNDPFRDSVTKLLYDMKHAHGLNIDVLEEMIALTKVERPRDYSLCLGVGEREEEREFFVQGGLSSFLTEYASDGCESRRIKLLTLAQICNQYLQGRENDAPIHLLKIDCEGLEEAVIRSADWERYRPWVVLVESTEPCTMTPSWQKWEKELLSKRYHFVMMAGVNRYYVADEYCELDSRFLTPDELVLKYRIFHAKLERLHTAVKTL